MSLDLTPTKKAYIYMLKIIIRNSTNNDDVEWAMDELTKVDQMKFRGDDQ
jgi:hypothetical protein